MEGSYIVSIRDIVSKGEGLFIKKSIKYEEGHSFIKVNYTVYIHIESCPFCQDRPVCK